MPPAIPKMPDRKAVNTIRTPSPRAIVIVILPSPIRGLLTLRRPRTRPSRSMGTHRNRCPPFETRALRAPQGEDEGLV